MRRQAFVEAGIPHVVAVQREEEVADAAAQLFTSAFYAALAAGRSVLQAFELGRQVTAIGLLIMLLLSCPWDSLWLGGARFAVGGGGRGAG